MNTIKAEKIAPGMTIKTIPTADSEPITMLVVDGGWDYDERETPTADSEPTHVRLYDSLNPDATELRLPVSELVQLVDVDRDEREQTMLAADARLRAADVSTLLTTAYSLTHRMHVSAAAEHAARSNGHIELARECAAECIDLRTQRNMIDAEIERRCER